MDLRHAMQSVVVKTPPAAGKGVRCATRRVGGDSRDLTNQQHRLGLQREPASVTRLAYHTYAPIEARAQMLEKSIRSSCIKGETWRELHQEHAEGGTQPRNLGGEPIQLLFGLEERAFMSDFFGNLDGKAKLGTNAARPASIGLASMRSVKR